MLFFIVNIARILNGFFARIITIYSNDNISRFSFLNSRLFIKGPYILQTDFLRQYVSNDISSYCCFVTGENSERDVFVHGKEVDKRCNEITYVTEWHVPRRTELSTTNARCETIFAAIQQT